MNTKPLIQLSSRQGSTLVIVALTIAVVAGVIATAMMRSQGAAFLVRNSMLNAQLRSVAEGELERLYYLWKEMESQQTVDPLMLTGQTSSSTIQTALTSEQIVSYLQPVPLPTTKGYNAGFSSYKLGYNWDSPNTLGQHLDTDPLRYQITPSIETSGLIPGASTATTTRGQLTTFQVVVTVSRLSTPSAGQSASVVKTLSLGRMFTVAKSATFQNAVFYNGTMEFTPGGSTIIAGDIAGNSDIYLGGKTGTGNKMQALGKVSSFGLLNGDPNSMVDNYFNAAQATAGYLSPQFNGPDTRSSQVSRMSAAQSFLDGLDVAKIGADSPTLFASANDVYHAIVDPPPVNTPDNADISPQRMYNKAGLRIEVKTVNGVAKVVVTDTSTNTDVSSKFTTLFPASAVRASVYDARENKNVLVTTIDVSQFTTIMNNAANSTLQTSFNGIIYAYDSGGSTSAIRLINGSAPPNYNSKGFTVATNSGLYIQGNYNLPLADGTTTPSVVMADAVTGLSNSWVDASSSIPLSLPGGRVASDTTYNCAVITGDVAQQVASATDPLTGNTTYALTQSSGGPHNLVRLLENWTGKNFTIKGSLVELFNSKTFTAPWVNQLNVYKLPGQRTINFDDTLSKNPPNGFVATTQTTRGDYFVVNPEPTSSATP